VDNLNLFDLFAKITLDTSDYEQGVEGARDKGNSLADVLKGGLATAGKAAAAGLAAAGTAAVALGKSALDSYAEYEQLVGGVDTLFKDASDKLQGYAANAYQTAGMSANDYMANITSFSAALINSVGGDTEKAADMADRAITDMADNANKMGTSLDSIVQTYQSLSRGNFAMLDNLKLGYGGTKAELERLLDDAEAYKASMGEVVNYDVSNFADIVSAIGAIQEKMGIVGATAAEAATTIEGSTNSMKAAWANLVTGIADGNADIPALMGNFVESVGTVASNIIPRVGQIAEGIVTLVTTAAPQVMEAGRDLLENLGDGVVEAIPFVTEKVPEIITQFVEWWTEQYPIILQQGADMLEKLAFGIIEGIPKLIGMLPEVITSITMYFTENFPQLAAIGGELLGNLIMGIIGMIPEIAVQLPAVITAIVDAIKAGWQAIKEAGMYLLEGLWAGIADRIEWLKGKVTGVVDTIKGWFTGPEGFDEHSPSRWAKDVFQKVLEGGSEGFESGLPGLMKSVQGVNDSVKNGFDLSTGSADFASSGLGMSSAGMINAASGGTGGISLPSVIELRLSSSDGQTFGRWMVPFIRSEDRSNPEVVSDAL